MNVLVISAHPDDEIIGMGGTLKKISNKSKVNVLFLADGVTARKKSGHVSVPHYEVTKSEQKKMDKEIEIRKIHAKKALKLVGVNNIKFLDLPDNELDTVPFLKIVKYIEKEISQTQANVIFTHHHNDLNIDHRIAYESTITATRPIFDSKISSIISFEAFSSSDWKNPYKFNPNMYVDISKEMKNKLKALEAYSNELRKFPHPRSKKSIEANAIRWGSLSGFKAAEAFEIIMKRTQSLNDIF